MEKRRISGDQDIRGLGTKDRNGSVPDIPIT